MVGLALDGKLTQAIKPLPSAHAILLVLDGIKQSTSKHQFITFCTTGTYNKPGTSSYTVACTKTSTTPSTVITQNTHHDNTPHHTRNLPNLQKSINKRTTNTIKLLKKSTKC